MAQLFKVVYFQQRCFM